MFACRSWPILLIVAVLLATRGNAADPEMPTSWPNWMGPQRNGVSTEKDWSSNWPAAGLPVVWSREIGIGFSSISLAQGRLLSMGHVDGKEIVWCLDAQTGDVIWNHDYPCELNDNLHEGGPGSTPTIDEDRVYTVGKEGQLICLDFANGTVIWEVSLQKDLGVPLPEWGFAGSPVIVGNQLLLEAGRVVSYDKHTGKKNWQSAMHQAGYGSAAIFPGEPEPSFVATLDCEGLRITRLNNGDDVAFQPWPSPFRTNSTTPIVEGNQIFISTAYNVGCGLFEFDGQQLKKIYANREMRNHFNNSILWNGYLYGFDGNSNLGRVVQLTCMEFATGKVAWQQRGLGCGSLMMADGKLLILSEKGTLVLANATAQGFEELATSPFLTGRCWTVPVLFDKHVYGRNAAGKLVCVDLAP